jgi:hypothetical protein
MYKTILTCFVSLTVYSYSFSQSLINKGNFRCFSANGPLMYYWNNETLLKKFTSDLDSILQLKQGFRFYDQSPVQFSAIQNGNKIAYVNQISSSNPQLNIDLLEYSTSEYLKAFTTNAKEAEFLKNIVSVLVLEASITKSDKTIYQASLEILLKHNKSYGIGIPVANLPVSASGFSGLLKKALAILLDSTNQAQQIEMSVPPAFINDNFLLEASTGFPKIWVDTLKSMSRFAYNNELEMIRWGAQQYKEIVLRGKNKTLLSDSLLIQINKERVNDDAVFVFLLQEGRDIVRNKNYEMIVPAQMYIQYDAYGNPMNSIKPVGGFHHYLRLEKDTIAVFTLSANKTDSSKKIFLHQSTNGLDIESVTNIAAQEINSPILYSFVAKGSLRNELFSIYISNKNNFREIYLNNQRVVIAMGNTQPEKLVVLQPEINPVLLNELLIIAFNSFLQ